MEVNNKIDLVYMSDFANLFLALYSKSENLDNDKVYFSSNFKKIIENIGIENYFDSDKLLNDENKFDTESFFDKIEHSTIKKYFMDDAYYDFEKDRIAFEVEDREVFEEMKKYNDDSIIKMAELVSKFKMLQEKVIREEKEYVKKLVKKSNM